ncbi:glycoside hydrolase family 66 protein [Mesobacillus subterraneus]|uniref:glycoside hydrolase family 66 protein n=2 Tax=Mesobacillus subterraneus TaxID=285983 RepID=UPI00203FC639|nr:glycoside hydrolase family 66 protein [Mesobacillus subterraneus]
MNLKSIWALLFLLMIGGLLLMIDRPAPQNQSPAKDMRNVAGLFNDLQSDKSRYNPGEKVIFSLSTDAEPTKIKVSYFHLNKKLKTETITNKHSWSWQPPDDDFKGYLVEVKMTDGNKVQTETIAVDVSSDWSRFPRYGFLSEFNEKSSEKVENIIASLNRYHLNGLQFYDWHFEHHQPLKMDGDTPATDWQDVANRDISLQTIQQYIDLAHDRNMEAMAYNLLYGSFESRGLPHEWHLFKDRELKEIDQHPLPEQWKSNINIMNLTNPWWQDHIIDQQRTVYKNLPFDGWHIDQLGDRGEVFNEWGDRISIADSFAPFLTKIKDNLPDQEIIMNAVNQYGQKSISQASPAFLYTEVWDEYKFYNDLKRILDENASLSDGGSSVLAAYMNYRHSEKPGKFNEPGILLANSVIFANGGAHLELGEHMLSKEYFPHNQLNVPGTLEKKLISYYDFLTAYENLLRDQVKESNVSAASIEGIPLSFNMAQQNKLWVLPKEKDHKKILHSINFLDENSMEWRDTEGKQSKPATREDLRFTYKEAQTVKAVWLASPDIQSGRPVSLDIDQKGGEISFTLPSLTYWNMVVIE